MVCLRGKFWYCCIPMQNRKQIFQHNKKQENHLREIWWKSLRQNSRTHERMDGKHIVLFLRYHRIIAAIKVHSPHTVNMLPGKWFMNKKPILRRMYNTSVRARCIVAVEKENKEERSAAAKVNKLWYINPSTEQMPGAAIESPSQVA